VNFNVDSGGGRVGQVSPSGKKGGGEETTCGGGEPSKLGKEACGSG